MNFLNAQYFFLLFQTTSSNDGYQLKEKWIVMIVRHPLLRSLLTDDIEFKKTQEQIQQERDYEDKQNDEKKVKKCPKCLQNYIPSQINYGNCHYHDGFVYDLDHNVKLNSEQAQAIAQKTKLLASSSRSDQVPCQAPKLMWACCLGVYGADPPCQTGICGLPEELKGLDECSQDPIVAVEKHFMNNQAAAQKIQKFLQTYKTQPTVTRTTMPNSSNLPKK